MSLKQILVLVLMSHVVGSSLLLAERRSDGAGTNAHGKGVQAEVDTDDFAREIKSPSLKELIENARKKYELSVVCQLTEEECKAFLLRLDQMKSLHPLLKGRKIELSDKFDEGFLDYISVDTNASEKAIAEYLQNAGSRLDGLYGDVRRLKKKLQIEGGLGIDGRTLAEKRRNLDQFERLSPETHAAMKGTAVYVGRKFGESSIGGFIEIDVFAPEREIIEHLNRVGGGQKKLEDEVSAVETKIGLKNSFLFKALILGGSGVAEKRALLDSFKALSPSTHAEMKGRAIRVGTNFSESTFGRIIGINVNAPEKDIVNHVKAVANQIDALDRSEAEAIKALGLRGGFLTKALVVDGDTFREQQAQLDRLRQLSPDVQAQMKGKAIRLGKKFAKDDFDFIEIDLNASENQILEHLKNFPSKE